MSTEEEIQKIVKDIVRKMKKVGTYNKSYTFVIDALATTLYDHNKTKALFEQSGGHVVISQTNKNGSTYFQKNPYYLTIERQRKEILSFSRELGLSPNSNASDGDGLPGGNELIKFLK